MMEEEDDIDLEVNSDMADVETLPNNGPTSALLVAASSNTVESGTAAGDILGEGLVSNAMKDESVPKDGGTEDNLQGSLMDNKIPTGDISDRPNNIVHVADKSKELFGDSQKDNAFDLSRTGNKDNPQTASQLFGSAESSESFFDKGQINESFEILDVNKVDFKAQTQIEARNQLSENALNIDQKSSVDSQLSSPSHLESSFETLSITNYNHNNIEQRQTVASGSQNSNARKEAPSSEVITANGEQGQLCNQSQSSMVINAGCLPATSNTFNFKEVGSKQEATPTVDSSQSWKQQPYNSPVEQQQGRMYHTSTMYQSQYQQHTTTSMQIPLYNMHEQIGSNPLYPGSQNRAAFSQYNPGNSSFMPSPGQYLTNANNLASPSIPAADSMTPKNNTGNSYMYTSPISSVIPQYHNSNSNLAMENTMQESSNQNIHQQLGPAGGLFVPDLYGSSTNQAKNVDIYTPAPPVLQIEATSPQFSNFNNAGNMSQDNSYLNNSIQQATFMQQMPLSLQNANLNDSYQDPGLIEWVKKNMNQDWGEGAKKLGQQIIERTKHTLEWFGEVIDYGRAKPHLTVPKNATETVLTTLDPGMEEYLNPVMNLAIASIDNNVIQGIRQGFRNVFGHTAVKSHVSQHSLAVLPVGFDAGVRATREKLDSISNVNFQFSGTYVMVAGEVFLTELQQGRWSCMFCLAVRDIQKRIEVYTFSQPISIPSACVSMAYNRTHPDEMQQKLGYNMAIDEAVRLYKPYAVGSDWCYPLNGMKLEAILALASQCLASDYRRELENPSVNSVEAISIIQ